MANRSITTEFNSYEHNDSIPKVLIIQFTDKPKDHVPKA